MELRMKDGDYVPDGQGGVLRCTGGAEVLQRVLYRLSVKRGSFPFLPELGSRLHLLTREKPLARPSVARQYVEEALAGEDLTVDEVTLTDAGDGRVGVKVELTWQGEALEVNVVV